MIRIIPIPTGRKKHQPIKGWTVEGIPDGKWQLTITVRDGKADGYTLVIDEDAQ